jgi:tRNA (guanine37-N1)-methyltransferase
VLRIDIITIFPEYFAPLGVSLIGKAARRGDIVFGVHDLRTWTHDPHRSVDDTPFGGGPGMVMRPEPWGEALDAVVPEDPAARPGFQGRAAGLAGGSGPSGSGVSPGDAVSPRASTARLVLPSPAGKPFTQATAAQYAGESHLIFGCGRYEGIDARVAEEARARMPVDEVTIGDYVLAGGEPAVLVIIEAVCRLLPGVLGNAESASDDSFGGGTGPMAGLIEGPAYTRPRDWRGRTVPPVLLSGDHAAIWRWRRDAALRQTAANRPDLAAKLAAGHTEPGLAAPQAPLDARDRQVLSEAGFPPSAEDMAH